MINSLKVDGVIRERKSKTLLTGQFSEIEIQCYECGIWKKIKKIENEHITKKFLCGSCKRKLKKPTKKKVTKKKVSKKSKRFKNQWPEDCPHKPFFGCKSPNECQGCYYNPDKKIAMMPKYGQTFDKEDKKNTKDHWFYHYKSHVKESLEFLSDIKSGKGLKKGGTRYYFKYARKNDDEE